MDDKIIDPYCLNKPGLRYKKPVNFDKMVELSKKLSEDFKFVRVDFYEVGGQLYLGELTFTPCGGFDVNRLPETQLLFGNMVKIEKQ